LFEYAIIAIKGIPFSGQTLVGGYQRPA